MRATTFTTAAVLALASHASAETIKIDVGENGLTFTPDSVTAKVHDILEFHFHPINHSVVMGDFANPCQPAKTGGFFSGFQPVSSGEAVCIKVLYSKQQLSSNTCTRIKFSKSPSTRPIQSSSTVRKTPSPTASVA